MPVPEQADAVAARLDGIEVAGDFHQGHVLVHVLAHHVGRLDVERDASDDTERSESDDGALERLTVLGARQPLELTGRAHELDRRHRRRQRAVGLARAMRAGADRAGDRNVGQRRQVVQRPPLLMQDGRQLTVGDARADRHGIGFDVNR